jgi:hypothetical protein
MDNFKLLTPICWKSPTVHKWISNLCLVPQIKYALSLIPKPLGHNLNSIREPPWPQKPHLGSNPLHYKLLNTCDELQS